MVVVAVLAAETLRGRIINNHNILQLLSSPVPPPSFLSFYSPILLLFHHHLLLHHVLMLSPPRAVNKWEVHDETTAAPTNHFRENKKSRLMEVCIDRVQLLIKIYARYNWQQPILSGWLDSNNPTSSVHRPRLSHQPPPAACASASCKVGISLRCPRPAKG